MAIVASFDRDLVAGTAGAFLSYGHGSDCDGAFDDASMSDRFDLGAASGIPSLALVDSSAPRQEFGTPVHPHAALTRALGVLTSASPGEVYAFAVSPLKEFAHRTAAVTLVDPALSLPAEPGPLWSEPLLLDHASALADLKAGEEIVSGVIPRRWAEKFKAVAVPAEGARSTRFALYREDSWDPIEIFDTAALARRAALVLARTRGAGPGSWRIVPFVQRSEGSGFTTVERQRIACKVPVKLLVAKRKNDARVSVQGWLFAGIVPDSADQESH